MIDSLTHFVNFYPSAQLVQMGVTLSIPIVILIVISNYYIKNWKINILVLASFVVNLLISSLPFIFYEIANISPNSTSTIFILFLPFFFNIFSLATITNRHINEQNDKRYTKRQVHGDLRNFNLLVSVFLFVLALSTYFYLPFSFFILIVYAVIISLLLLWLNLFLFIKLI